MRILIIEKDALEKIPPIISVIEGLIELGHSISIIAGGANDVIQQSLKKKNVSIKIIPFGLELSYIEKIKSTIKFRNVVNETLKDNDFDLLWIEGHGTFRWMPSSVTEKNFVMQISELYDAEKMEATRKAIRNVIHKANVVVMPEFNRATLYQVEHGLKQRPMVLPNKPYFYLTEEDEVRCEKKYEKELTIFKEKKVILYQGIIHKERDLSNYIKAVKELGDDYRFVLLGKDFGVLDEYRKINPDIIHINFIPAPDYLYFTAHAYAGIVTYEPTTLNCAYCAPNKIYEYGRYSLPMLANDIPGLIYTIGHAGAGAIVYEKSVESIKEGILKIDKNHALYAQNARKFYDDTDNVATIEKILEVAMENKKCKI